MKPGAGCVAASRSGCGTVAFSWEQEPGVSKQKQGPAEAMEPTAGAPRADAASRATPAPAKKAPPPPAHRHRLRVPPPPGGPGAPAVSPPPGKSGGGSRSRRVRPRDDPFLAAYLACTDNDGSSSRGTRKLLGWAGLGLGLGLGLRGFGLSCKNSCGAECVVTLARILEPDEDLNLG
ncbi:uncharacterized protein LOC120688726 [Panicum virgatum]|uniref:Uncharacterized protein n=1 Tax=Panicum virgatum TaxID=38727 RepID=A0A8T0MLI1_PANVG|nr:uncharacterized protein LOC120688726 [Panicum virgatum]KAG2536149.1 hypothetical protein PVAP13_9NG093900 [Panicum virgatum]